MAKLKDIIGGLQIIAKYEGDDSHLGGAEHDIIYAGVECEDEVSEEDKKRLDELGWHADEDVGGWTRFV